MKKASRMIRCLKDNKLGAVTLSLSLTFTFVGLPAQILKIWETRNVKGVSFLVFALMAIQSVSWMFYGIQKKDWVVMVANIFGIFFSLVIIAEYVAFR